MDAPDSTKTIKNIIRKYLPEDQYQAVIFGSRANNTNLRWSDIDVGLIGKTKIPLGVFSHIQEELTNSKIPYRVDIVDLARVSDQFRQVALSNAKPL